MPDPAAVRAARPTVSLAGRDNPSLVEGLLSLLVVETTAGLYRCEATFGNWGNTNGTVGYLYFDRSLLEFGRDLQIRLGADAIFSGRIMGLEAHFPEGRGPEVNILAEDRFQDLRMTRRTRSFSNLSDAEVINQIAADHGLRASVNLSGPRHEVLSQINQSDLAFLRERARALDAELWMEGGTLNVKSHARRNGSTLRMTYGDELREFSVLSDLSGQRTTLSVSGWDVAAKAALHHEATDSVISGELNGDLSGASVLRSALGPRKEGCAGGGRGRLSHDRAPLRDWPWRGRD
jgi:hypothetical protein